MICAKTYSNVFFVIWVNTHLSFVLFDLCFCVGPKYLYNSNQCVSSLLIIVHKLLTELSLF